GPPRTVWRRPLPQYYTSSHILLFRDRSHGIRILLRRGLQCRVGSWCLFRDYVRHRISNRRRNLRALGSPAHVLLPEKPWSHATLESLRNIDIPQHSQPVHPPIWQRRILAILLGHRSVPLHRLPRRRPSSALLGSILPGMRN